MEISGRSWRTTGVAVVGAGAVALAPITPSWPVERVHVAPMAISAPVQLSSIEFPYILTLPIVRQLIANWAQNWAVYLGGFAQSGIGLVESVIAIPGITVEVIRQILEVNFVGAFQTVTQAIRDSVVAVGQPLLDSLIWRNQKALLVDAALSEAIPRAIIDVTNGFLTAGGEVATALIQGTQDFVAAVLTLNLSNIVDAAVEGTTNFLASLGAGAATIVNGIESAQLGIATALATEPPPAPTFDYSEVTTPAIDSTVSVSTPLTAINVDGSADQSTTAASGPEIEAGSEPVADLEAPALPDASKTEPASPDPVSATPLDDDLKHDDDLKQDDELKQAEEDAGDQPDRTTGAANDKTDDTARETTDPESADQKAGDQDTESDRTGRTKPDGGAE